MIIQNLISESELGDVASTFEDARLNMHEAVIDLTHLDRSGAKDRRVNTVIVALLSNLFMGCYSDLDLHIIGPLSSSITTQLQRGGLQFSLANRLGSVSFTNSSLSEGLEKWNQEWRPALGDQLFDDVSPEGIEERLYLYSNTHKLGQGYFRNYEPGAAMPWLGNLIPVPRDRSLRHVRNSFVVSTVEAIVEGLENIPRHAFKRLENMESDWLRPHGRRAKSALLCSLTKGGGEESWDRLHVVILDNGYGIGRTLRWQHPTLDCSTGDLIDTVIRRKFLERGIEGHSGRGLWYFHGLARIAGGECCIATEDDIAPYPSGVRSGFISPAAENGPTEWREHSSIGAPIRGSVIVLDLAVPRAEGEKGELYLEQLRTLQGKHQSVGR